MAATAPLAPCPWPRALCGPVLVCEGGLVERTRKLSSTPGGCAGQGDPALCSSWSQNSQGPLLRCPPSPFPGCLTQKSIGSAHASSVHLPLHATTPRQDSSQTSLTLQILNLCQDPWSVWSCPRCQVLPHPRWSLQSRDECCMGRASLGVSSRVSNHPQGFVVWSLHPHKGGY